MAKASVHILGVGWYVDGDLATCSTTINTSQESIRSGQGKMAIDPMIGRTIRSWTIVERIGRGGMGRVYRATHPIIVTPRAIKVLHSDLAEDEDAVRRLQHEAKIASSLEHQNIVQVYDVGEEDGIYFLTMRLVAGSSLYDTLRRNPGLSNERSLHVLRQKATALDHAHARGIVHRDIKPANVMIGPDNHVTITDFGIAQALDESRHTRTGQFLGTWLYAAPEQVLHQASNPSVDLYALGIVAYELLTGRTPFSGGSDVAIAYAHAHLPPPSPLKHRPELSSTVERVLLRQLAKSPAERHPTAVGFVDELTESLKLIALREPMMAQSDDAEPTDIPIPQPGLALSPKTDVLKISLPYDTPLHVPFAPTPDPLTGRSAHAPNTNPA